MGLPNFFYHPRMLGYDLGPSHPLKPERLRRAIELLERVSGTESIDPGEGRREDALRVHSPEYVAAVEAIQLEIGAGERPRSPGFGFGTGDNPVFPGMYDASLAYLAGSVRAAEVVRDGAPLAFGLAGGLHHAHRERASGFCIFNDAAGALSVLRERFDRVAYVDIDVHHGDGVQWIFFDDPHVLTCSIHEDPRTLFPGTGGLDEVGPCFTSINAPVPAGSTGDAWLAAFRGIVMPALARFQPQAIVLQMGTDAHELDPLAHLRVTAQEWLEAVQYVRDFGVPIVAVGGGGYNLLTVPRMWVAACMTLGGMPVKERLPDDLAEAWATPRFSDPNLPAPRGSGMVQAEGLVRRFEAEILPGIPKPA